MLEKEKKKRQGTEIVLKNPWIHFINILVVKSSNKEGVC